jgi:hypothetical protein
MKSYQENGWEVTTPIYMGSQFDVAKAQACAHKEYREIRRSVEHGAELVQEECTACIAIRMKSRLAAAGALDLTPADVCPLCYHRLSDPAHQECVKERRT